MLLQSQDGHASTDICVSAYHDPARVEQLTAGPQNNIVSDGELLLIVAVKRRPHIDAMTQMTGNMALTSARVDLMSRNNSFEEPRTLTSALLHSCVEAE